MTAGLYSSVERYLVYTRNSLAFHRPIDRRRPSRRTRVGPSRWRRTTRSPSRWSFRHVLLARTAPTRRPRSRYLTRFLGGIVSIKEASRTCEHGCTAACTRLTSSGSPKTAVAVRSRGHNLHIHRLGARNATLKFLNPPHQQMLTC